jgi:hypothetical protein
MVAAAALNGLAVVHAYFHVFSGTQRHGSVDLSARWSERIAILVLTVLILGGGLYPQPGVASRHHAATKLLADRPAVLDSFESPAPHAVSEAAPPARHDIVSALAEVGYSPSVRRERPGGRGWSNAKPRPTRTGASLWSSPGHPT